MEEVKVGLLGNHLLGTTVASAKWHTGESTGMPEETARPAARTEGMADALATVDETFAVGTSRPKARGVRVGLVAALFGVLGWGCSGPNSAAGVEELGSVSLDLSQAPSDARCALITATPAGAAAVTRSILLTPGQNATFLVTSLPQGSVTLTEQIFTVGCASLTGNSATWIADPITVNLVAGVPVDVTFNLRRASDPTRVTVHTNFPDAPNAISEIDTSLDPLSVTPKSITTGPDGALWFVATPNIAGRVSLAGQVTTFVIPNLADVAPDPMSIATGPDQNLWIAARGTREIIRLTPSGALTRTSISNPGRPTRIAVGADNRIWFIDDAGGVSAIATTGGLPTRFALQASEVALGLAAGPDGNMWVTGLIEVLRVTPTGAMTSFPLPRLALGTDMAFDGDGNLWITQNGQSNVGTLLRMTPTGETTEFSLPGSSATNLARITAGPDGNVWFTESQKQRIGRITTAGAIAEFTIAGRPTGIATGPDGNVWFTELVTGTAVRIGAIRP